MSDEHGHLGGACIGRIVTQVYRYEAARGCTYSVEPGSHPNIKTKRTSAMSMPSQRKPAQRHRQPKRRDVLSTAEPWSRDAEC